jgi:hypothetical protein
LALAVVGMTMVAFSGIILFAAIEREWNIMLGVASGMSSLSSGIVGYYFGSRNKSSSVGDSSEFTPLSGVDSPVNTD